MTETRSVLSLADSQRPVSTQQLSVDWSRFEEHVFFSSAVANVNVAFAKLSNGFPFDGTAQAVDDFVRELTGFERWIYDAAPKWVGHVSLSGSGCVFVSDSAGALFAPAGRETGPSVLSPVSGSLTVEAHLSPATSESQIVAQHSSGSIGWQLAVSGSAAAGSASLHFAVRSGSTELIASAPVQLGSFSHVAGVFDASDTLARVRVFVGGTERASSSGSIVGQLDLGPTLTIGSGSSLIVSPAVCLTGSIDEFRVWKAALTAPQLRARSSAGAFAGDDLALRFAFNEPPAPVAGAVSSSADLVAVDGSGNSLHGLLSGSISRISSSVVNPLPRERAWLCPVLFPEYAPTAALRAGLVASASLYDAANPNLITKLVPRHVLADAARADGGGEALLGASLVSAGLPATERPGSVDVTLGLLLSAARTLDEVKLWLDSLSAVDDAWYDSTGTCASPHLAALAQRSLLASAPELLTDAGLAGWQDAVSTGSSASAAAEALARRLLTTLPHAVAAKGTQHSVALALRSFGIEPGSGVRVSERGVQSAGDLDDASSERVALRGFVDLREGWLASRFLSASRTETGWPHPRGAMVSASLAEPHGRSDWPADGLLTSGSWTFETTAWWPSGSLVASQSIARIRATGSAGATLLGNLTAVRTGSDPAIVTFALAEAAATAPVTASVSGIPLLDGGRWTAVVSYERSDDGDAARRSGSLTLTVASAATSSFARTWVPADAGSILRNTSAARNASGAWLEWGQSAPARAASFLSGTVHDVVSFDGAVHGLRFWSRALSQREALAHASSLSCHGSTDPAASADTVWAAASGAFERLRFDCASTLVDPSEEFPSAFGTYRALDCSINGWHVSGTGFTPGGSPIKRFADLEKRIPSLYDESVSSSKVRIMSLASASASDPSWTAPAPLHSSPARASAADGRFDVDFALADSFSRTLLDAASDAACLAELGSPEAAYALESRPIAKLRDQLTRRFAASVDWREYAEHVRWIERALDAVVTRLVPHAATFRGVAVVVEPHALERGKLTHRGAERHERGLAVVDPSRILLQQIAGELVRR